jgi:putative phosphoribosyl transferase
MSNKIVPDPGEVQIVIEGEIIGGTLGVPENANGLVIFAHGSGSSRFSPRNRLVAERLQEAQFATLLMDLLTPTEAEVDDRTAELRFNIPFLGRRLSTVTDWAANQPAIGPLTRGYFGASTGAAAALVAASERHDIAAVVSRGGRPDLAGDALPGVKSPTLLLVGSRDTDVIELNREAQRRLGSESHLEMIPGATHPFEEPGTLERVAERASEWFMQWLPKTRGRRVA